MFKWLLALACLLLATGLSQAHFLWLIPGDKTNTVKLVFSDKLGPDTDNPELIDKVKQATLYVHDPEKWCDVAACRSTAG